MKKRKRFLTPLLLGALLVMVAVPARAATITVQPGRSPVSLSESFRLVFSADGSVDGDPDFSPLKKNFQILGRSQGSQINIINGHYSHQTRWTLEVMAKRAGTLTIPPIHFGRDASPSARITVLSGAAAQAGSAGSADSTRNFFLEVSATPKNPYVQAQVLYTVRLYRTVDLNSATLSDPKLTSGDAIIEKLGKADQYQTRRNGRLYAVIERKYAIFPQQSGKVTIAPVVFEGQVVENGPNRMTGNRAIDQFDNFFNHFNSLFSQQQVRTERLASLPVVLQVRPIPTAFTGKTWLPAKKLEVQAGWSDHPPQWKIGVPVTRTLTVRAVGLTAAQLPKLVSAPGDGLKEYPDEPSLKQQKQPTGVIGTRSEKVAIMPSRGGTFTLPALAIPWWNTTTDRMEIARLPARVIHVAAETSSGPAAATPPAAPTSEAKTPGTSATPASLPPATAGPAAASSLPVRTPPGIPWFWVSLALAAGWVGSFLTLALLRGRRRRREKRQRRSLRKTPARSKRPVPDQPWDRLRQACANHDPRAAREELLAWGRLRWPQQSPTSLEEVAALCGAGADDEIRALTAHLYGRGNGGDWMGNSLWQALEKTEASASNDDSAISDGLEPLYKL